MSQLLAVYVAGVAIGCWRGDAPPLRRLGLALLWPVAVAACLVTLSVLLVAAVAFFPMFGVALGLLAAAAWWVAR